MDNDHSVGTLMLLLYLTCLTYIHFLASQAYVAGPKERTSATNCADNTWMLN